MVFPNWDSPLRWALTPVKLTNNKMQQKILVVVFIPTKDTSSASPGIFHACTLANVQPASHERELEYCCKPELKEHQEGSQWSFIRNGRTVPNQNGWGSWVSEPNTSCYPQHLKLVKKKKNRSSAQGSTLKNAVIRRQKAGGRMTVT